MTAVAVVHVLTFVAWGASQMACGVWRIEGKENAPLGVSSRLGNLVTCPKCRRTLEIHR